jgi:hypothetical protein
MRQILLHKLRGTRISRSAYLYTLENSIFHSFAPYRPIKFEPHKRGTSDVSELSMGDNSRSGYPMLDAALGSGFPRKSVILLELDSRVDMTIALIFLEKIVSNFVLSGNPVILQPAKWLEPSSILRLFEASIPASKKSLFKILRRGKTYTTSAHIISRSKNQSSYQPLAALAKMKQRNPGKLLLNIMWTEAIQSLYGAKSVRSGMKNILSSVMAHADLSIAVLTHSQEDLLDQVSEVSNIRLRFIMINDTLFLQCLLPPSNLYSLVFDGRSELRLRPVV